MPKKVTSICYYVYLYIIIECYCTVICFFVTDDEKYKFSKALHIRVLKDHLLKKNDNGFETIFPPPSEGEDSPNCISLCVCLSCFFSFYLKAYGTEWDETW